MTLELVSFPPFDPVRTAGYAGPLAAARHPELADRFHFWRGASGARYACTRFPVGEAPAYENAIALFVRRRGGEAVVVGIGTVAGRTAAPFGTDEVHLHIVQGGFAAFEAALADLAPLVVRRSPLYLIDRCAA